MSKKQTLATFDILETTSEIMSLKVSGSLDSNSLGDLWPKMTELIQKNKVSELILDVEDVDYCDGAGIGLFVEIYRIQNQQKGSIKIINLKPQFKKLLDLFINEEPFTVTSQKDLKINLIENLGKNFMCFLSELKNQITFTGELLHFLMQSIKDSKNNIRWNDVMMIIKNAGIHAIFIVVLINFLMGLIMAFQAAIPMRQFGADIYVSNLVALSILRVLGPLMTAIILAGRTSSAFAAELGTMKVNEEIDALKTMGLNPIKFLVTNRVIAIILLVPVLTLFAEFAGLLGGGIVVRSFGYPWITYVNQILSWIGINDFLGGFVKSFVFGLLIASVGCYKGLGTKMGASAVGLSTTSAVVNSLILIIIAEGIFSVVYYFLGI